MLSRILLYLVVGTFAVTEYANANQKTSTRLCAALVAAEVTDSGNVYGDELYSSELESALRNARFHDFRELQEYSRSVGIEASVLERLIPLSKEARRNSKVFRAELNTLTVRPLRPEPLVSDLKAKLSSIKASCDQRYSSQPTGVPFLMMIDFTSHSEFQLTIALAPRHKPAALTVRSIQPADVVQCSRLDRQSVRELPLDSAATFRCSRTNTDKVLVRIHTSAGPARTICLPAEPISERYRALRKTLAYYWGKPESPVKLIRLDDCMLSWQVDTNSGSDVYDVRIYGAPEMFISDSSIIMFKRQGVDYGATVVTVSADQSPYSSLHRPFKHTHQDGNSYAVDQTSVVDIPLTFDFVDPILAKMFAQQLLQVANACGALD